MNTEQTTARKIRLMDRRAAQARARGDHGTAARYEGAAEALRNNR